MASQVFQTKTRHVTSPTDKRRNKVFQDAMNLHMSNMSIFNKDRPRTTPTFLFDGSVTDCLNTDIPKVPHLTIPAEWDALKPAGKALEPINSDPVTRRDKKSRVSNTAHQRSSSCSERKIIDGRHKPRHWVSADRLNELRTQADLAVKQHKIFMIRGGFHSLRRALIQRGWIEKIDPHKSPRPLCPVQSCADVSVDDLTDDLPTRKPGESMSSHNDKCSRMILNKFLMNTPVDFFWIMRRERIDQNTCRNMTCSRFQYVPFTNKEGLCNALRDMRWHYEEGIADIQFPRCYNIWLTDEFVEFTEDFRLTACISLLKWIVATVDANGQNSVCASDGQVPYSTVHFAMKRCDEYLESRKHGDLDEEHGRPTIWEHEWDQFLENQHLLTHKNGKITEDKNCSISVLQAASRNTISLFRKQWPQMDIDGMMNIWIVKPGNKCRGRGIRLMNNIKDIAAIVDYPLVSKAKYVVQKYIEKPLVIYATKFDIRQWFLVTNVQPLIVWMYKDSYLRFSSQQFDLSNYHESVHLTNNAVQCKYKNAKRHMALPEENMWDCGTFQAYLKSIGSGEMWQEKIYPGMRQAIIGALLSSQDHMDRRPNTFELFGADFMLGEDFTPWLLEINSSPDMAPTTSVTARLCPQCLEDIVKVIIDRKADAKASTGNFELIYSQKMHRAPAYLGQHLVVRGRRILRPYHKPVITKREPSSNNPDNNGINKSCETKADQASEYSGPVVGDFIEYLKNKTGIAAVTKQHSVSENSNAGFTFEQPVEQQKKKKRKGVFANSDFSDNISEDDDDCINNNISVNSNDKRSDNNGQHFLISRKNLNEHNRKSNERNAEKSRKRLEIREADFSNENVRMRHRHCFSKGVWERDTSSILDVNTAIRNMQVGYDGWRAPLTAATRINKQDKLTISPVLRASTSHLVSMRKTRMCGQADPDPNNGLLAVGLSLNHFKTKYQLIKRRERSTFPINAKYITF